jgi:hypothetical protein
MSKRTVALMTVSEPRRIDISGGISVGGFHYDVDMSEVAHKNLHADSDNGQCDCFNHVISIDPDMPPVLISKTFIHEIIEAVDQVYCDSKLDHEKIQQLSYGLHQVFESLGVRFVGKAEGK